MLHGCTYSQGHEIMNQSCHCHCCCCCFSSTRNTGILRLRLFELLWVINKVPPDQVAWGNVANCPVDTENGKENKGKGVLSVGSHWQPFLHCDKICAIHATVHVACCSRSVSSATASLPLTICADSNVICAQQNASPYHLACGPFLVEVKGDHAFMHWRQCLKAGGF